MVIKSTVVSPTKIISTFLYSDRLVHSYKIHLWCAVE